MVALRLDTTDWAILRLLQDNARMAQVDIAKAVGLAASAVMERIRKLEARGVIRGYTAIIDPKVAQHGMLAFVAVQTTAIGDEERQVAVRLGEIPEVLEVHFVAGNDCFLLKLRARDAEHVGELIRTRIAGVPGVGSTRTTIVLGSVKETSNLPLPAQAESDDELVESAS
jgi:Lrp/AsnC family transcriptional regulator, leucine-responsive regulatory protein